MQLLLVEKKSSVKNGQVCACLHSSNNVKL